MVCDAHADFGASKAFQGDTITEGMKSIKGSAFWMAPEVIKGTGVCVCLRVSVSVSVYVCVRTVGVCAMHQGLCLLVGTGGHQGHRCVYLCVCLRASIQYVYVQCIEGSAF